MKTILNWLLLLLVLSQISNDKIIAQQTRHNTNSLYKILENDSKVKQLKYNILYEIDKTINIQHSASINGNYCTLKGRKKIKDGKYLFNTLLSISNKKNIVIKNFIFDGGYTNEKFSEATDKSEMNNLISIDYCENITFENCVFQNFSSNWKSKSESFFGAIGIRNSSKIKFVDCKLLNFQTEGIVFYESENIQLTNLVVNSDKGWSGIHFWYCKNINCENVNIKLGSHSGSAITGAYSSASFRDITIDGGKGIQFSNEMNTRKFFNKDILFENCTIKSNTFGIGRWNYDDTFCENIRILNCSIVNASNSDDHFWGIRFDNIIDGIIQECKFSSIASNSSAVCISNSKDIKISRCKGDVCNFIFLNIVDNIDGLDVMHNHINIVLDKISGHAHEGTFLVCKDLPNNSRKIEIANIKIKNNSVDNIYRGILLFSNYLLNRDVTFKDIDISHNKFNLYDINTKVDFAIYMNNGISVKFEENHINGDAVVKFQKIKHFHSKGNRLKNKLKID